MNTRRFNTLVALLTLSSLMLVHQNFSDSGLLDEPASSGHVDPPEQDRREVAPTQSNFDQETQNETLDEMNVEDEMLLTSTDDLKAQQKEARNQAAVAAREKKLAEIQLSKTKLQRDRIEVEAKVKIEQELASRKDSLETKARLSGEIKRLEKEIFVIERRMEKAEQEARAARVQAKRARASFLTLRQKKARLLKFEKARLQKQRAERNQQARL